MKIKTIYLEKKSQWQLQPHNIENLCRGTMEGSLKFNRFKSTLVEIFHFLATPLSLLY